MDAELSAIYQREVYSVYRYEGPRKYLNRDVIYLEFLNFYVYGTGRTLEDRVY